MARTAQQAYTERMAELEALQPQLANAIEEYIKNAKASAAANPQYNWCHASELADASSYLREVINFLKGNPDE